ncbi:MAG: chemotaxis protein CheA [Pseudomonadota bacterium]
MSTDISQFLDVFYEESFEGLDIMEAGLLDMPAGPVEGELINSIFRAAHSIKGGGGTFGLTDVSDFTHVMETLLDEMRAGDREMTGEANEILLQSVDCLREMLTAKQQGGEVDEARIGALAQSLESLLGSPGGSATSDDAPESKQDEKASNSGWVIKFAPHKQMLENGKDPVPILRELAKLGKCEVNVDTSAMPDLYTLEPESCYLSWDVTVEGDIDKEQVTELFEWVEDECDLRIEPLALNFSESATQTTDQKDATPAATPSAISAPATAMAAKKPTAAKAKESGSIRVSIDKIDTLINTIGELVITQSMLSQIGEDFEMEQLEQLTDGLAQLARNTRELQEGVLGIRMLPISFAFNRFPRMVHDTSNKLGKKVELIMSGQETEVDKTVMEKIGDPLVHLVRNSIDHGVEAPDVRKAAGKPETGTVELSASHRGGNIIIEIKDDGAGINKEKLLNKAISNGLIKSENELSEEEVLNLVFHAGLSTAEEISDVSGRGVGMDVVRSNIRDLGGTVDVTSEPGKGSIFTIRLPLTLAILDGQTIAVGDETYIIPLVSIVESIQVHPDMLNLVAGKGETFKLRDEYLSIIRLHQIFGVDSVNCKDLTSGILVVVEGEGGRYGLFVDELRGQQQVVIKSLEANYRKVDGISGATILGDGSVALILDLPGLIRLANRSVEVPGVHQQNVA